MCLDWDHQKHFTDHCSEHGLEPVLSAGIATRTTCQTCMWQYSSGTDIETALTVYSYRMLGNTPVFFLGFVCCLLELYFSSWSCLLISVGWAITHSLHSMDLALTLWQTILDGNSRPLVHLPRDNTRVAGDPTVKDSRSPPRLACGTCSWWTGCFIAVRLKENLEQWLCLIRAASGGEAGQTRRLSGDLQWWWPRVREQGGGNRFSKYMKLMGGKINRNTYKWQWGHSCLCSVYVSDSV